MPSVIFLDFDGVLNHRGTFERMNAKYEDWKESDPLPPDEEHFEPRLVERVARLAVEERAMIAVVSSWRNRFDAERCEALLRAVGLPDSVFVTSCAAKCGKGEAIRRFLDAARVSSFVILDDGPGELPRALLDRLVAPNGSVGITDSDVERARRILARKL